MQFSRREFLQTSAASGAAWTALSALPQARAATAASDKVVLGIMGTHGRGNALARDFAKLSGATVAYVCDVDSRAVDKALATVEGQGAPRPRGVGDFRQILDDPAVDALVIAAPDHWHAPAAILACQAGKHVYVEKPASQNPHEGELMVQAARKFDRVVQVGTQRRSSAGFAEGFQRLREGEIGRVFFARGWINSTRPTIGHGKPTAVPEYLDYALWQGPAPARAYRDNLIHYHWHWFWHWGTGELGNNGVHALDLMRWALDLDLPQQVTCSGGKFYFDDDQETPDTQLATFNFGDRAITWEHRTWHRRGFEGQTFGVTFYGDKGTMIVGDKSLSLHSMEGKQLDEIAFSRGDIEHLENFLDCIRTGDRPNCDVEEGVKSALLCHLGNIAYRTGRTVNFDPASQKIVGDAEQLALCRREYAPSWEPTL